MELILILRMLGQSDIAHKVYRHTHVVDENNALRQVNVVIPWRYDSVGFGICKGLTVLGVWDGLARWFDVEDARMVGRREVELALVPGEWGSASSLAGLYVGPVHEAWSKEAAASPSDVGPINEHWTGRADDDPHPIEDQLL